MQRLLAISDSRLSVNQTPHAKPSFGQIVRKLEKLTVANCQSFATEQRRVNLSSTRDQDRTGTDGKLLHFESQFDANLVAVKSRAFPPALRLRFRARFPGRKARESKRRNRARERKRRQEQEQERGRSYADGPAPHKDSKLKQHNRQTQKNHTTTTNLQHMHGNTFNRFFFFFFFFFLLLLIIIMSVRSRAP